MSGASDGGSFDRRSFLRAAMAGAGGAAGAVALAGCRGGERQIHKVISQLDPTPASQLLPDHSVWYASACDACDAGCGIHVRVVDGRAKKVEGAPDHPVSRGGICARGQALVQGLYHPDRSGGASLSGAAVTWDAALDGLRGRLAAAKAKGPGRVALVGARFPGALGAVAQAFCEEFSGHPPLTWSALHAPPAPPPTEQEIEEVGVIVNLGAPILEAGGDPVGWAKSVAAMRGRPGRRGLLIHVGPRMGATGATADVWLPCRPGAEHEASVLAAPAAQRSPAAMERAASRMGVPAPWLAELAARLDKAGKCLLIGGGGAWPGGPEYDALRHLSGHVARGSVDVLVHVGPNPFERADRLLGRGRQGPAFRVALVTRNPEAGAAELVLRTHTCLEDWGSRVGAGGVTLQQPVVSPRWQTRGVGDLLLALMGRASMREFVAGHHSAQLQRAGRAFDEALGAGGAHRAVAAPDRASPAGGAAPASPPQGSLTLLAYEAATTGDGALAHTPWLREAREPVSGGLGDPWAELSPTAAAKVGVLHGGRVRITTVAGGLVLPVRVHPGQRDDVVCVPIGQAPGGPTDPLALFGPDRWTDAKLEAVT